MAPKKFVSAKFQRPIFPSDQPVIKAIGDDGLEYYIPSMETDVPPWPQFLAEGGIVEDADPLPEPSNSIRRYGRGDRSKKAGR
ncbi:MAG: hypothetical protein AAAB20_14600 [Rhizobium sp.]|jgi:hypothetical protein|uniref:hypothetical protein n=1 Tax=Rhizobium sp. TaxID=391 RepID=UPI0005650A70